MRRARIELFVLLLAFWLVLSDQPTVPLLTLGVLSAAGVAWLTGAHFERIVPASRPAVWRTPMRLWRFAVYGAWLLWRVLVSSVDVAWLVLHPRMPVEPYFLRFRTGLTSPVARTTLANSITLVPGTMTVRLDGDEFLVHALWPGAADDLRSGAMQRRVAVVFGEPREEGPVPLRWEPAGGSPGSVA